ncbi:TlpA disulfide reductase family protein [Pedobacter deserti]|uniref:TlpA disulfide reductase family protein n=1 Tax=Pedobacter deserti TaxID=2817382 RepID=UPI002109B750|nr:TlpA disulfide reductase family protein [Pedobacter sp. SYSU D00382]
MRPYTLSDITSLLRITALFSYFIFCHTSVSLAQDPFVVKGKIKNLPDGTVINLMRNEGNLLSSVDKDTLHQGVFHLSDSVAELSQYGLMIFDPGFPSGYLELWARPGSSIKVQGTGKYLKTWKVVSNIPEQKDLSRYISASEPQLYELQALSAQESTLRSQRDSATQQYREVLKRQIDSLRAVQDSITRIMDNIDIKLLSNTSKHGRVWLNRFKTHARFAKYSPDTLYQQAVSNLYKSLPATERESHSGQEIRTLLYPPVVVKLGEKMADTALKSLDGTVHTLSDFKGKYLLIDFWSIGCGPCIAAMPELKALHERFSDQVTIVSFSLDEKLETWKKASEHVKVSWTNLTDGKGMSGLAARYGVSGIPHYIIISPDGVLIDSWVGYSQGLLTKKLEKLLKI